VYKPSGEPVCRTRSKIEYRRSREGNSIRGLKASTAAGASRDCVGS
jgi:hypothetical protein